MEQLRKLLRGLLSVFQADREQTAPQLSLAVNGGTNVGIDIDNMLVHLVKKGLMAPLLIPACKQAIVEWMASRQSQQPSHQQQFKMPVTTQDEGRKEDYGWLEGAMRGLNEYGESIMGGAED